MALIQLDGAMNDGNGIKNYGNGPGASAAPAEERQGAGNDGNGLRDYDDGLRTKGNGEVSGGRKGGI